MDSILFGDPFNYMETKSAPPSFFRTDNFFRDCVKKKKVYRLEERSTWVKNYIIFKSLQGSWLTETS